MLRMMKLRRRTHPKIGAHTLCERAQSKCTSTCHNSHPTLDLPGTKCARRRGTKLREPAQSIHVNISQEAFYTKKCYKKLGHKT